MFDPETSSTHQRSVAHECAHCGTKRYTEKHLPKGWITVATGRRSTKLCSLDCALLAWPDIERKIACALKGGDA